MRRVLMPVLLWGILGTAVPTWAEPVSVVTAGNVDAHEGDNTFVLMGSGFRLSGEIPFINGPLGQCVIYSPCAPGTSVNLSASNAPNIYGDPALFNGSTYEGYTEYGGVFFSGNLSFSAGSVIVPAFPPGTLAERMAPFTFTGVLNAYDNFALSGSPLFSTELRGRGTATMQFSNQPEFGGINGSRITYRFEDTAPVPEPATVFLLAAGLGTMALSQVRRRRHDCPDVACR